jgi:putative ABC transport system permease protein
MQWKTILVQCLRALGRSRLRSALTILGIAIGIGAVVCVVAIGNAGSDEIQRQFMVLGENLVWIEAGNRNVGGVRSGSQGTRTLLMSDLFAIEQQIPLIKSCAPQVDTRVQVVNANQNWSTVYRGVTPEYFAIKRWEVAEGTPFTDEAVDRVATVCLLGQTVKNYLFPDGDAVGKTIRIRNVPFTVIGTLRPKGITSTGNDQDDTLLMPYTTGQKKIEGKTWLNDIMCSAVNADAVKPAGQMAAALLRERHRIRPGQDDDFNIRNPEDQIQVQLDASETLATLLISVGSVSLLVGGIGIMNVMLVSVTERTREIGVRLAVGATEQQIRVQFLSEAVLLCVAGGLVGIFLGVLGTVGLGNLLNWAVRLSLDALAIAALFSIAVGVFFGYYPAQKAARLDPIEALRFE